MTTAKTTSSSDALKITWSTLFPHTMRSKLKAALKEKKPEEFQKNLRPKEGEEMQKVIVRILIPEKYRRMNDNSDITDTEKTQFSRYFTYYDDNSGANRYETVKRHILNEAKSGNWDFDTFPFNKTLKENIISLFEILPQEDIDNYKNEITKLIHLFTNYPVLKDYKDELLKKDFYSQMTSLTAIAATWHCWYNSKSDASDLSMFILPSQTKESDTIFSETDWRNAHIRAEKINAKELLKKARKSFFEQKDYHSAAELCTQIIKKNFADELVIGEAYYHLAICCADYGYDYKGKENYKELLAKAVENGYSDARSRLYKETGKPYPVSLLRPIADTHGTEKIILNTENVYSNEFRKSIPVELRDEKTYSQMIITASTRETLENSVQKNKDSRFLLIDDSHEKNFQDFLYILDKIMSSEKDISKNDMVNVTKYWSKTTIYIRISEDRYSSLIDTALKRLGDFTIRVFTIDDNKWSSQYLLNRHPLFKPIEFLPQKTLNDKPVIINFTIISQGNIELTTWLIREAFWLGCFHYSGITLVINLISPDCSTIESQLHFDCPDMFQELPDSSLVSRVLPLNKLYNIESISSPELINVLNELNGMPNSYHYYVINTGDDIENLNYGIKIREWSIQNLIESGKNPQRKDLPMIAFYCKNSDIAHLSKNMVVQTVDCGNLWYNNYNLIPFGMLGDRYSWEQIDGGYLEKVAESTHLQYCGSKPSDSDETKMIHLKDYFSRSYNRDSSMAVALSMPYRLFQTAYSEGEHILPDEQIPDFTSAEMKKRNIITMAEQFKSAISDPNHGMENKRALLCYEHSRWLRWAISRGWKKATPEEVLNYMHAGNPKHQLHIARLHGCICSLDELKTLSDRMCSYAETTSGNDWKRYAADRDTFYTKTATDKRKYANSYQYIPKDFTAIDKRNIEATSEIIATEWFSDINKENEQTQNGRL